MSPRRARWNDALSALTPRLEEALRKVTPTLIYDTLLGLPGLWGLPGAAGMVLVPASAASTPVAFFVVCSSAETMRSTAPRR